MPRALISGGTGVLGLQLAPRMLSAGYTVRIMSRRADARPSGRSSPPDLAPKIEWARADLQTDAGLAEAVSAADIIVHAATNNFLRTKAVDVDGTRRLLDHARAAGLSHFLYISIVGIDRIPLPYYKHKLAAERLIEASGLPFSILRATQFHNLLDRFLRALVRLPVAFLPTDFKFQPIDPGEVAERMVEHIAGGPSGRLPDLGGPQVLSFGQLARLWLKARRRRAWLVQLPLPGKIAAGFRRGDNCVPENAYGRITWSEWLARTYGNLSF